MVSSADFTFQPQDYWRSIILYGLNTATYKIALGHCLAALAQNHKTYISMTELAEAFFGLYQHRLSEFKRPQLSIAHRLTVMERIIELYAMGTINYTQAIQKVEREAFKDVIPRFHTIADLQPMQFYEHSAKGLVLTDNLLAIFSDGGNAELLEELSSRWDLLEAAFELKRASCNLSNDERQFYLKRGYERTHITHLRPVLNGYQDGLCFYCGEQMLAGDVDVDHLIPRQFVYHDEPWNLVLAHTYCNTQKSDALPELNYLEKLIERNEHFIASNHPLKKRFIDQLGSTPEARSRAVQRIYQDAQTAIPYTWKGIRGYDPRSEHYRSLIRQLNLLKRLSR
jgi:hypothetical protein